MFDSLHRISRRSMWLRAALVVAVTAAVVPPTPVSAADRHSAVPDHNALHDDITWSAESGITKGCNPPANDMFCPSDNVTRQQMAAFMRRLAEGKVVDAATADSATTAESATTAGDADTLDGKDSSAFLTSIDTTSAAAATSLSSSTSKTIEATCPAGYVATGGGAVALRNDGGDESDLMVRGATPTFTGSPQLPTGWIAFAEEVAPVAADWRLHVTVLCIATG